MGGGDSFIIYIICLSYHDKNKMRIHTVYVDFVEASITASIYID